MCISTWDSSQNWQNMGKRMNKFPSGSVFRVLGWGREEGELGLSVQGGVGRGFSTGQPRGKAPESDGVGWGHGPVAALEGSAARKGWEVLGASSFSPLGHVLKGHRGNRVGTAFPNPANTLSSLWSVLPRFRGP